MKPNFIDPKDRSSKLYKHFIRPLKNLRIALSRESGEPLPSSLEAREAHKDMLVLEEKGIGLK